MYVCRSFYMYILICTYITWQAPGQRFFGHYPDGEFRFNNGRPSFFSNGIDFDLPPDVLVNSKSKRSNGDTNGGLDGRTAIKIENEFIIITYRFNHNVEISVNGGVFACVSCDGEGASFSSYTKLFSQVLLPCILSNTIMFSVMYI